MFDVLKKTPPDAADLPEVGELIPVEAIDRSGLAITSDGTFVRIIHVRPANPLIMSPGERAEIAESFATLLGKLKSGQSLQIYIEARPVFLEGVLRRVREQVEAIAGPAPVRGQQVSDERSRARWRLYAGLEESLRLHSDDQAAVKLDAYVVVPFTPQQPGLGFGGRGPTGIVRRSAELTVEGMREALGGARAPAALRREMAAHRRAVRESLQHAETIRAELDALDLPTHMLNGQEVARLLWGRFNPTRADVSRPPALSGCVEVLGESDTGRDIEEATAAARKLRDQIGQSALDFDANNRWAEIDRDLEQTIYASTTADVTFFGWLLPAMQVRQPFTLSVHVHALDKMRERTRAKMKYRRLYATNRGAEYKGRPPDFDRYQAEGEHAKLLQDMGGSERAAVYKVSVYQSIRERGPSPDPAELQMAVDYVAEQITTASDVRVNRGEFQQQKLWRSTLPLGLDVARHTRKYVTRNVGETIPLVGTACGSPGGIPLGFAEPGRTIENLDPYDPSHDNYTLLINGKSGGGKTFVANVILRRILAMGAKGYVLDRAGHYRVLTQLIPGAQEISLGASHSEHGNYAVNPWDVEDVEQIPLEKINFLTALHMLLIGNDGPVQNGQMVLERTILDGAIRAVYTTAREQRLSPRESMLRDELFARQKLALEEGDAALASTLKSTAERLRSFCGDGSYAYLLDRETTVPGDAPLVVFDTREVPEAVMRAVVFVISEHVAREVERHRDRHAHEMGGAGAQIFTGRSFFLIDEAWKLVESGTTGEFANDLARRARHLGLFLILISQQLSDFNNEYGKALIRNSTMQLYLRQVEEELDYVQDAVRLTNAERQIISKLKTRKGVYSQLYFINGVRGRGQVALRVGPHEYWASTSEPVHDVPTRERTIVECDGDVWRAITQLSAQFGTNEQAHSDDDEAALAAAA